MYIGKVSDVTDELYSALQRLIPQLTTNKAAPGWDELTALVNSESSSLLIARYPDENSSIAGILTLAIYRVPTGLRSIVEDVVVDERMRGQGIGEALMFHAINLAREAGASGVTLTSNPRREAANHLYQAIGFKRRETNAYYLDLK
ncbi:MAG: GNAT family N-acetyltransferase [Anaerolineae bacterium]|nr:GNAT family N-acetyltransferase [Anaerolineae bacterium]MCI0609832.1 GNAT family N-acetyltransferase [Anaerolineae bacterium]